LTPPRIIWSLWLQGWDQAPEIVDASTRTWSLFNPGWEVRRLVRADVQRLFAPGSAGARLVDGAVTPETLSDLVRIELLERFGGVWADATTYCLRPLDDWLPEALASGFFAFDRPSPRRMISSWFLAAAPASPAIAAWARHVGAYWSDRSETDEYFWFHRLFGDAYQIEPELRRIWDATPKIPADGPHAFLPYAKTLPAPVDDRAHAVVEDQGLPMLKLTHKLDAKVGAPGTLHRWLVDRVREMPAKDVA
jgi:hypothetical protein